MTDQQQAEPKVEDKQPAPMPSAETKPSEPKVADSSPQGDTPAPSEGKDLKLPEDAKERTSQQFEKLKSQLSDERSRRVKAEQVYTQMQKPKASPPAEPESQYPSDYYDPETETINVTKLQQKESQLQQQVQQLSQQVKSLSDVERVKQETEAYTSYPELDPSGDKFNQDFHDAVSGALTAAYMRGETPSFREVGDKMAKLAGKESKKAEKAGATKALEQLSPKEQASLEATGRSDRRSETKEDMQNLQLRTRKGDNQAIIERLKGIPAV